MIREITLSKDRCHVRVSASPVLIGSAKEELGIWVNATMNVNWGSHLGYLTVLAFTSPKPLLDHYVSFSTGAKASRHLERH